MEVLRRFGEWLSSRRKPRWEPLETHATGFSIGPRRLEWSEIESIAAFKQDQATFDVVWFQIGAAGDPLMVCEDQPGFETWEAALVSQFPCTADWRNQVIHPPFARSFTLLYRRT